jgi:hypothetical protein
MRRILLLCLFVLTLAPMALAAEAEISIEIVDSQPDEVTVTDMDMDGEYALHPGPLREQIAAWALRADHQLKWMCEYDILVEFASSFGSNFQLAVTQVVQALRTGGTPITGTFYSRSKVLVIEGD